MSKRRHTRSLILIDRSFCNSTFVRSTLHTVALSYRFFVLRSTVFKTLAHHRAISAARCKRRHTYSPLSSVVSFLFFSFSFSFFPFLFLSPFCFSVSRVDLLLRNLPALAVRVQFSTVPPRLRLGCSSRPRRARFSLLARRGSSSRNNSSNKAVSRSSRGPFLVVFSLFFLPPLSLGIDEKKGRREGGRAVATKSKLPPVMEEAMESHVRSR